MVLQFIKGIFAIGAIAVELGERQNLLLKGGDKHAVFVGLRARPDLNEAERQLARAVASGDGHALFHSPAQDDDLALTAPALQPQRLVPALPALAGAGPSTLRKSLLDQFLNVGGKAQPLPHRSRYRRAKMPASSHAECGPGAPASKSPCALPIEVPSWRSVTSSTLTGFAAALPAAGALAGAAVLAAAAGLSEAAVLAVAVGLVLVIDLFPSLIDHQHPVQPAVSVALAASKAGPDTFIGLAWRQPDPVSDTAATAFFMRENERLLKQSGDVANGDVTSRSKRDSTRQRSEAQRR